MPPPVQEKYHDANPVVRALIGRFFARIATAVRESAPAIVLDAGCGEGELARRGVLPPDVRVISLDLRQQSLAYFRDHSNHRNLVCGSLESLPLRDKSVDTVLCLEVLEHLDDPSIALGELARVARRCIIVSVPYEPYFRMGNVLRGKHLERWGDHPEHVQHWNLRTFRKFLEPRLGTVRLQNAFPWIVGICAPRD